MTRQEQDEGFLSRWARRKAQVKPQEQPQSEPPEEPAEELAPAEEAAGAAVPEAEAVPDDLPDPEALGRDDDWSPFLKRGVPAEIRTKALRRLWRLDPVFANLDGLVDYADDYNGPEFTGKPVKTLFKVGRGMLVDETPSDPQPQVEVADNSDPLPEEDEAAEEVAASGATEQSEPAQSVVDAEDAESTGSFDSPTESDVRSADPVRDNPPRRRGALARRWGMEAGDDPQNR